MVVFSQKSQEMKWQRRISARENHTAVPCWHSLLVERFRVQPSLDESSNGTLDPVMAGYDTSSSLLIECMVALIVQLHPPSDAFSRSAVTCVTNNRQLSCGCLGSGKPKSLS